MGRKDDQSGLLAVTGLLGVAVVSFGAARLLPHEVASVLVAWILASLPIGMLFGHCALSED
nr:hypothetical protein [uncultured Rhodopila sp.]